MGTAESQKQSSQSKKDEEKNIEGTVNSVGNKAILPWNTE